VQAGMRAQTAAILMCLHSAHHPPIHTHHSGGGGYNNDLQTPARARRRLGAAHETREDERAHHSSVPS
jgi:hypothetical protein